MKKIYLTMVLCLFAFGGWAQEETNFHPFIENNKTWNLFGANFGGYTWKTSFFFTDAIKTLDNGVTYQVMYRKEHDGEASEVALLREDDGRVYFRNPNLEKESDEQLIYDFTLKEGDTFELFIPDDNSTHTCEVVKVGQIEIGGETYKTITYHFGVVYEDGIEGEVFEHTWIEGIGSSEGPLSYAPIINPISMVEMLTYVGSDSFSYTKSFDYVWVGWRGRPLLKGEDHTAEVPEEQWGHDDLHYEFLPGDPWGYDKDTLHVYGKMWLPCGGDCYVYCIDDYKSHEISLEVEYPGEATTCMGFYSIVDLYFPFFSATSGVQYTITDSEGTHKIGIKGKEIAEYRPFIEDGKVWTVKYPTDVDGLYYLIHYYFTNDDVVDGKPCKRMFGQYDYKAILEAGYGAPATSGGDIGCFYEEGKRVYYIQPNKNTPVLLYDFGAEAGDTIYAFCGNDWKTAPFVIDHRMSENTESFKGTSTIVRRLPYGDELVIYEPETWMEGVGGKKPSVSLSDFEDDYYLMACTVGDEVLYKHQEWNLNNDTEGKKRVDFTHVVKTQPKSPQRKVKETETEQVSGEYNASQLMIDLGTLHGRYAVTITDKTCQTVYQKEVQTNSVVALDIDISAYANSNYTITLENPDEIFTGTFSTSETDAIHTHTTPDKTDKTWYDLTGRPVKGQPQRGIYLREGQKVLVR